eukprot:m.666651 g.666651  ORF g.666651 m.666651 type:complete len:209 (+) comp22751_c0_seq4:84-710(+)
MALTGKRALVTGSTSGIGAGIAEQLANAGCDVVLHGLGNPDEIEAFRARLSSDYNVKVEFTEGNLATEDGALQMLKNAGKIDILVNNAGVQHVSAVEDMPLEKWNFVMAINLTSAFIAIKECIPFMYEQGWGRIVNVASAHGKVASMNKAPYVASKHGLLGISKVVALEAAAKGGGNDEISILHTQSVTGAVRSLRYGADSVSTDFFV